MCCWPWPSPRRCSYDRGSRGVTSGDSHLGAILLLRPSSRISAKKGGRHEDFDHAAWRGRDGRSGVGHVAGHGRHDVDLAVGRSQPAWVATLLQPSRTGFYFSHVPRLQPGRPTSHPANTSHGSEPAIQKRSGSDTIVSDPVHSVTGWRRRQAKRLWYAGVPPHNTCEWAGQRGRAKLLSLLNGHCAAKARGMRQRHG